MENQLPESLRRPMSTLPRIPAAQYVRASTDRQEYSATNQATVIAEYAERNGFSIIKTYDDPATSGVVLRLRKGLQSLVKDVVHGEVSYKAILVCDVSRWGRFQDADESAYYEFLCKSAGSGRGFIYGFVPQERSSASPDELSITQPNMV
jgi:hypothetical protein